MPALSAISSPTVRDWTDETVTAAKLEADPSALKTAIDDLRSYLADNEKNFSATAAPTDTTNGFLWHDSSGNTLEFRRSAAWETVATEKTAKDIAFIAGSGTGTIKLGGTLASATGAGFVYTTQVQRAGATGALIAATIPASTLSATGHGLRFVSWGTKTGASSAATLQVWWGSTAVSSHGLSAASTDWRIEGEFFYTGAAAQDLCTFEVLNRDDTGLTNLCNATTATVDTTAAAVVLKIEVSSVGLLDSIQNEVAYVEWING